MYGEKIRFIREMRGLSQENIASKLGIAQNAYSRIETNHSKLGSDILLKLATILQVSPMDILSSQPAVINFQYDKSLIENIILKQAELYDKLLTDKDEEIKRLNLIIEKLLTKKK